MLLVAHVCALYLSLERASAHSRSRDYTNTVHCNSSLLVVTKIRGKLLLMLYSPVDIERTSWILYPAGGGDELSSLS